MSGSFATLARSLAQQALSIIGDLAVSCAYTPTGTLSYDPSTGLSTNTGTPLTFKAAYVRFGPQEIDGKSVIVNDARLIVAGADLGVLPNENDIVTITMPLPNGTTSVKQCKVIRSTGSPGAAVYRIHIREV